MNVSCMITIDELGLLVTGSNDTTIRLYNLKVTDYNMIFNK